LNIKPHATVQQADKCCALASHVDDMQDERDRRTQNRCFTALSARHDKRITVGYNGLGPYISAASYDIDIDKYRLREASL